LTDRPQATGVRLAEPQDADAAEAPAAEKAAMTARVLTYAELGAIERKLDEVELHFTGRNDPKSKLARETLREIAAMLRGETTP